MSEDTLLSVSSLCFIHIYLQIKRISKLNVDIRGLINTFGNKVAVLVK